MVLLVLVPFLAGIIGAESTKLDDDVCGDCLDWLPPPEACCIRQWILNQLDRRPYRDPDFDIPTIRHFRKRHALQAVRFFLLITQR